MKRPIALMLALLLPLAACEDQKMAEQSKLKTFGTAPGFAEDAEARPLPAGTVPQEAASRDAQPALTGLALVQRGQEEFDAFCSPCHGYAGYGDGMVVARGFPAPPSFHSARLRNMPAQQIVDTITNGYGVMYSYADRVPEQDRWAIAAYIRALQLSQAGAAGAGGGR
jgi:mono/diheme cytochrome c family protein